MPYPEPGPLDYLRIMWVLFRFRLKMLFWKPKKGEGSENKKDNPKNDASSTEGGVSDKGRS